MAYDPLGFFGNIFGFGEPRDPMAAIPSGMVDTYGDARYMDLSPTGEQFIKGFEKFRGPAYDDGYGTLTIGWGHTKGVREGDTVTKEEADALFAKDVAEVQQSIAKNITVPLSQAQYDTLVSFGINAGPASFNKYGVTEKLNIGDYDGALAEMGDIVTSKGVHSRGLVNRRADEAKLWAGEFGAAPAVAENTTSPDQIAAVQQQLASRGFDPGPVDGQFGPQTQAALDAMRESQSPWLPEASPPGLGDPGGLFGPPQQGPELAYDQPHMDQSAIDLRRAELEELGTRWIKEGADPAPILEQLERLDQMFQPPSLPREALAAEAVPQPPLGASASVGGIDLPDALDLDPIDDFNFDPTGYGAPSASASDSVGGIDLPDALDPIDDFSVDPTGFGVGASASSSGSVPPDLAMQGFASGAPSLPSSGDATGSLSMRPPLDLSMAGGFAPPPSSLAASGQLPSGLTSPFDGPASMTASPDERLAAAFGPTPPVSLPVGPGVATASAFPSPMASGEFQPPAQIMPFGMEGLAPPPSVAGDIGMPTEPLSPVTATANQMPPMPSDMGTIPQSVLLGPVAATGGPGSPLPMESFQPPTVAPEGLAGPFDAQPMTPEAMARIFGQTPPVSAQLGPGTATGGLGPSPSSFGMVPQSVTLGPVAAMGGPSAVPSQSALGNMGALPPIGPVAATGTVPPNPVASAQGSVQPVQFGPGSAAGMLGPAPPSAAATGSIQPAVQIGQGSAIGAFGPPPPSAMAQGSIQPPVSIGSGQAVAGLDPVMTAMAGSLPMGPQMSGMTPGKIADDYLGPPSSPLMTGIEGNPGKAWDDFSPFSVPTTTFGPPTDNIDRTLGYAAGDYPMSVFRDGTQRIDPSLPSLPSTLGPLSSPATPTTSAVQPPLAPTPMLPELAPQPPAPPTPGVLDGLIDTAKRYGEQAVDAVKDGFGSAANAGMSVYMGSGPVERARIAGSAGPGAFWEAFNKSPSSPAMVAQASYLAGQMFAPGGYGSPPIPGYGGYPGSPDYGGGSGDGGGYPGSTPSGVPYPSYDPYGNPYGSPGYGGGPPGGGY